MGNQYSVTLPEEGIYEAFTNHISLDLSPIFCVTYSDDDVETLEDLTHVLESACSDESGGYETTAIGTQDHIDRSRGNLIVVGPQSNEEDIEQVVSEVFAATPWHGILGLIVHEDMLEASSSLQRMLEVTAVSESTGVLRPSVFQVVDGSVDLRDYYPVSKKNLSRILVETR